MKVFVVEDSSQISQLLTTLNKLEGGNKQLMYYIALRHVLNVYIYH